MKKILSSIFLFTYLLVLCQEKAFQRQDEDEVRLFAKVESIDSLQFNYIIHISHNSQRGMFIMEKICENKEKYKEKLKIGKSYQFLLKKRVYMAGNPPEHQVEHEYIDDKLIWSSETGIIYYENCLNMCGLLIDDRICKK